MSTEKDPPRIKLLLTEANFAESVLRSLRTKNGSVYWESVPGGIFVRALDGRCYEKDAVLRFEGSFSYNTGKSFIEPFREFDACVLPLTGEPRSSHHLLSILRQPSLRRKVIMATNPFNTKIIAKSKYGARMICDAMRRAKFYSKVSSSGSPSRGYRVDTMASIELDLDVIHWHGLWGKMKQGAKRIHRS
jgi:hypothetical protein